MFVYLLQFLIIILLTFIYQESKTDYVKRIILGFLLFIIVLITGFRDALGHDYLGYLDTISSNNYEIAFSLISGFISLINLPDYYIFVVYSLITYFFLLLFIKEYDNKILYLMVAIFFALPHFNFQTYNLVRQMAAVTIFAYASSMKNNPFKQYALIVVCFTFHSSVIFALPVLLIFNRFKQFKFDYILYLVSFIFVLFPEYTQKIFLLIGYLNFKHYDIYINSAMSLETLSSEPLGTLFYVNILITLLVIFKKEKFYAMNLNKPYNLFIVGQILNNILLYEPTLIRISYYFVIYYIIVVPYLTVVYTIKNIELIRISILVVLFILLVIFLSIPSNPLVPYKSCIFK